MTYSTYNRTLITLPTLLLLIIAGINFSMDPAGIYPQLGFGINKPKAYAEQLIHSENGLLFQKDQWNMQEVKKYLARSAPQIDCAIYGSSHVLQISSAREDVALEGLCDSITNLGVFGATLEDFIALSWDLLHNDNRPENLIIGIPPWALNWNMDKRWTVNMSSYQSMMKILGDVSETETDSTYTLDLLSNLINPQLFIRSLKLLKKVDADIIEAPVFDHHKGFDELVVLPDGSIIYSREYLKDKFSKPIPDGPSMYKINLDGKQYTPSAVETFKRLSLYLQEQGINVVFLLTPYHQTAWQNPEHISVKAYHQVETVVHEIGQELSIPVIGSYDPEILGCTPDEFIDKSHPTSACIAKIPSPPSNSTTHVSP